MNTVHITIETNTSSSLPLESDEPPSWIHALSFIPEVSRALDLRPFAFTLYICDAEEAQRMNLQYRNKPYPTNVLSFPADLPEFILSIDDGFSLGDLVCCPQVIEQEALDQNKSIKDHWAHMVIHGALHLLGFDHVEENDAETMEAIEIQALQALGISSPYQMNENQLSNSTV